MKLFITIIAFSISLLSLGQTKQVDRKLKVVVIKDTSYAYLIGGVDSIGKDTLYFISLKHFGDLDSLVDKISIGNQYLFRLDDMDYVNGFYTPVSKIPNGYRIEFGEDYIKRQFRNGKDFISTQYRSINTKGLFIKKFE